MLQIARWVFSELQKVKKRKTMYVPSFTIPIRPNLVGNLSIEKLLTTKLFGTSLLQIKKKLDSFKSKSIKSIAGTDEPINSIGLEPNLFD